MLKGLKIMPLEDRYCLEDRWLRITVYKNLRDCHVEDGANLFSVVLQGWNIGSSACIAGALSTELWPLLRDLPIFFFRLKAAYDVPAINPARAL